MNINFKDTTPFLKTLYFLSGFSALIYQLCWQRLLFLNFGTDIESITIIISSFMLGLGLGSLVGGALSDHYQNSILKIFIFIEFGIGLFGLSSPTIINFIHLFYATENYLIKLIINFLIMLIPTLLMGATLPLLTRYLFNTYKSIGIAIGELYFYNTLGASIGSLFTVLVLFSLFTINQSIFFSATVNFLIAASGLYFFRGGK